MPGARSIKALFQTIHTTKIWMQVAVITLLAVIMAGGIAMWGASRGTNLAHFDLTTTAPGIATFTDDNNITMATDNGAATPEPNNNRHLNRPAPLYISYSLASGEYAPAFKMGITDTDIANAVKITPFIRGKWRLDDTSTIAFIPEQEWPADTKFSIRINRSVFNPDVVIDTARTSFTTAPLTATMDSFALYPGATAKTVTAVAVVSFNYAVDTKKFENRATMRLDGRAVDFTVRFDKFHRTAFLTSAPVTIGAAPQVMRLKINRVPAASGDAHTKKITASATIEAADNIFKITSLETTVADDNAGLPQQLILLNTTTAAADTEKIGDYISAYLLPRDKDESDNDAPYKWQPDEVTPDLLKKAKKLALSPVEFSNPAGVYQYAFSYDVSESEARFIYVSVKPGIMSTAGFALKNGTARVMKVPYPARTVSIAGNGALLAMGGERKLGITARGGADAAYINLYKVKATEINHLISQSYNVFSSLEFKSWSFGAYDMAVVFRKTIPFSNTSMKAVNYASVDLGDYLDRTHADKTGIFIVQTGASENSADYNDMRLILLTDFGIIRKTNNDDSSTVFISSLTSGAPAADTEIYVLGRNGNAIWAGRTDEGGRADIPAFPWREYRQEKQPVAIVARRDNDVSFIPYDAYDRQVEYSKFDVDGAYATPTSLNAYLFSDRGIYRPGEEAVIGAIVKSRTFKSPAGAPVRLEIRDARGRVALEKTVSLTTDGMFDVKYNISDTAPVGEYYIKLFSVGAKNKPQDMLGMTTLRVEEFVPDTLKINADISAATDNGWISPENIGATVKLRNMFGTPATDKRISARAVLTPATFKFASFPDYSFTPNFISDTGLAAHGAATTITQDLDDVQTDENGDAVIRLNLENADEIAGTYNLRLDIQGFEGGSGRGVRTAVTARVSNDKYLVGYHANSDLSYIARGAARSVKLAAVDHTGTATAATDLTMRLIKRENLTSLIKDYNDTYKYQTISRDKVILSRQFSIPATGTEINLDTTGGGTYYLQILNAAGKTLANIEYFVAAATDTTLSTDSQAEMQIKLNASEYAPGDEIEVAITAPYAGAGLITIERDRVYAYKWFRASGTSSVQKIKVPSDFEGTGYINVSFVRDIASHDIFTTPYAYAVAPFTADAARHTIGIKLSAPDVVRDGKLTVKYETDKNARLMIFATNNGILQVAKYNLPNPIAHFFQKAALQVNTFQTLSLLLPEYKILREFAKTGGGDYDAGDETGAIANPFARRLQAPVAFYSDIISATAGTPGTVTFNIPDDFNGEIKVYAVAAAASAAGSAATATHVMSPIMISANTPLFVAPNDRFEINAVVANQTENETSDEIRMSATASEPVTLDTATTTMNIKNGDEGLWTIPATAATPGASNINITAAMPDKTTRTTTATMSVRPVTTFDTRIKSGVIEKDTATVRPDIIDLYPETATRRLYISRNSDAVVHPLVEYLRHYDWTCTEQITSRALPYALIGASDVLNISAADANQHVADAITILKNRQNDDGSFALWASYSVSRDNAADANAAYITAWATQFLTIARANGFDVPRAMLSRATDYLRTYAGTNISDEFDAATHAFAIYVITQNEFVTTSYIDTFEEYANKNIKNWESKLMGAYIAAAYKIMRQTERAADIIAHYTPATRTATHTADFDNTVANDAIYQYIMRRHFNAGATAPSTPITAYINSGDYDAFTSAAVIMGLAGGADNNTPISVGVTANGTALTNISATGNVFVADIAPDTKKLEITCPACNKDDASLFWTIIQQGYPTKYTPAQNGIEIIREYYNDNGDKITSGNIGDTVTVKILARTRGAATRIPNAVIVDLMPGGFIATPDSITGTTDFVEVREDRVLIYAPLSRDQAEFTYTAQLGAAGTFAIPPIHAESMYNAEINATSDGGTFTVTNATGK